MDQRSIENYFFGALLVGALALAFFIFLPFLGAVLLAVTLAVVFRPLHDKILSLTGLNGLAAFLTVLVVLGVFFTPITFFGIKVFGEAVDFYAGVRNNGFDQRFFTGVVNFSKTYLPPSAADAVSTLIGKLNLGDYLEQIFGIILQSFTRIFSGAVKLGLNLFLAILALYYFFKGGRRLRELILEFSPLERRHGEEILTKLEKTVNSVFKGTLIVAIIQGVLAGVGFFVFGLPSPAFWGLVTVFASLIPTLGTAIVVLPAAVYLFFMAGTVQALGLLIWGIVIVGLIDNLLRPKLIERDIELQPFLVLLSVLGGLQLFGPIGFLLGPLTLSFLVALLNIYPGMIKKGSSS